MREITLQSPPFTYIVYRITRTGAGLRACSSRSSRIDAGLACEAQVLFAARSWQVSLSASSWLVADSMSHRGLDNLCLFQNREPIDEKRLRNFM